MIGDIPAEHRKEYAGQPFCAAQLSEFDFFKPDSEYS
jgi:hypothetical protein